MKKSGKCPKCGGTAIVNTGHRAQGRYVALDWWGFTLAPVDRLVCATCGFAEDWVSNPAQLPAIRNYYKNG